MKRTHALAVAALAAVASIAIYLVFFRAADDDAAIRARLTALATALRVAPGESPVVRATRVSPACKEVFTEDVTVDIAELSEPRKGRSDLIQLAISASGAYASLDVDFGDVHVTLDPQKTTAGVDTIASLSADRGGAKESDRRKVHFEFVKVSGEWRARGVTVHPRE